MKGSSGIFSKVIQEFFGPRRGLYLISGGVIAIVFGCFGVLISGGLAQEISPGTLVYAFTSLLAWDTLLMLCGGFFLVMGGGIYVLIQIDRNRPVTPRTPIAQTSSPQPAPVVNQLQQPGPIQPVPPVYAQPSSYELTLEQRREILQREINMYVRVGYLVISQTDTTAQLVRPKQFSYLWFVILTFLLAASIFYLVWYLMKRDEQIYIEVDRSGQVRTQW